jgi:hypothetical protein
LYTERHTKVILEDEKKEVQRKLQDVKTENSQMNREIQRNKMFNKKDEDKKAKRET